MRLYRKEIRFLGECNLADTRRNDNAIITPKRRRFDVIMMLLLRHIFPLGRTHLSCIFNTRAPSQTLNQCWLTIRQCCFIFQAIAKATTTINEYDVKRGAHQWRTKEWILVGMDPRWRRSGDCGQTGCPKDRPSEPHPRHAPTVKSLIQDAP